MVGVSYVRIRTPLNVGSPQDTTLSKGKREAISPVHRLLGAPSLCGAGVATGNAQGDSDAACPERMCRLRTLDITMQWADKYSRSRAVVLVLAKPLSCVPACFNARSTGTDKISSLSYFAKTHWPRLSSPAALAVSVVVPLPSARMFH